MAFDLVRDCIIYLSGWVFCCLEFSGFGWFSGFPVGFVWYSVLLDLLTFVGFLGGCLIDATFW